jgi:hypothetical protein
VVSHDDMWWHIISMWYFYYFYINKTPAQAFTLTCLKMRTYALWCKRQRTNHNRELIQYSVYQNNSNPNLACNNAEYIWQIRLVFTPLLSSFIYFSNDMLYASFSWKMKEYCFDKKVHKNHNFPPMGIGHFFFQS